MKRTIKLECPNCGCHNQQLLLAGMKDNKPILRCAKCNGDFFSQVLEKIYNMGRQASV